MNIQINYSVKNNMYSNIHNIFLLLFKNKYTKMFRSHVDLSIVGLSLNKQLNNKITCELTHLKLTKLYSMIIVHVFIMYSNMFLFYINYNVKCLICYVFTILLTYFNCFNCIELCLNNLINCFQIDNVHLCCRVRIF